MTKGWFPGIDCTIEVEMTKGWFCSHHVKNVFGMMTRRQILKSNDFSWKIGDNSKTASISGKLITTISGLKHTMDTNDYPNSLELVEIGGLNWVKSNGESSFNYIVLIPI